MQLDALQINPFPDHHLKSTLGLVGASMQGNLQEESAERPAGWWLSARDESSSQAVAGHLQGSQPTDKSRHFGDGVPPQTIWKKVLKFQKV